MNIGLKTYLAAVTVLISGLPILVFLLWPYTYFYDQKLEAVEDRHLLMSGGIATSLELYRSDLVAAMETFSLDIVEGGAIDARPIFKNLNFYRVCVVRKSDGAVVSSYMGNDYGCASHLAPDELASLSALADGGGIRFGGVVTSGGPPRIQMVADAKDFLVQATVLTTAFQRLQSHIRFGENGHAVIVDRYGGVIAHPSSAWEDEGKILSQLPIVQAMMRNEKGVMKFYSPHFGEEMVAGYSSVPGPNWGIMVVQPLSEFAAAAARFNREVSLILLIGFAGSLLVAFYVAIGFEARIKKIQSAVGDIADGVDGIAFAKPTHHLDIVEFQSVETGISTMFRKLSASESRYRNMFENVPIACREDDLHVLKRRVDTLSVSNLQELEQYLDSHPEFIVECGKSIKVVDANAASLALHAARNIDDLTEISLQHFEADSLKFLRAVIIAAFKGETRGTLETSITSISGDVRHLITTWCVLPGFEDTFSRSLVTSIDVTDQLEAEKKLRHAHKMKALGQLTGGIAHDFNNLLTVMGGNAELLALNPSHEHDLVDPIQNAVQRGAELTQRLLAFSRKQTLQPQAINMVEMASEMGKILHRTLGPNIDIRILAGQDDIYARADPGQVEAALLNLAINARDAMPTGGVLKLSFGLADPLEVAELELKRGEYIVCSVTDSGEGMSEKTQMHAFDPFFTTKGVGKGSGLGLSMVYGFANQSNGTATITSQLGHGTTIKMFLPRAVEASDVPEATGECIMQDGTGGLRILVLEDNEDVMNYLEKMLHGFGHSTLCADSIHAAWKVVDSGVPFDLLVSDVLLPGPQKGTDFAKELRSFHPDCPIVFISGYPNTGQIDTADTKTEWLAKPFSGQDLQAIIEGFYPDDAEASNGTG